ncbi:hypothetical protein ACFWN7_12210 [Agromyces sp. NPDC058484]|uniref:hypothetical protein n=1 Tax=Agromyces sp. NPDC058484 TaxID=3346524 RepID=UPI00364D270E
MHDNDSVISAILGRAVTPERIDAARRHLVMLCALLEDVRGTVPTLALPNAGSWRSDAADRYLEELDDLRGRLFSAKDRLADAVYSLEERIRRMQDELDSTKAASPVVR